LVDPQVSAVVRSSEAIVVSNKIREDGVIHYGGVGPLTTWWSGSFFAMFFVHSRTRQFPRFFCGVSAL